MLYVNSSTAPIRLQRVHNWNYCIFAETL